MKFYLSKKISGGEYQKGTLISLNTHSIAATFNSERTTQEGDHGESGDESCDHEICKRLILALEGAVVPKVRDTDVRRAEILVSHENHDI